MAGKGRMQDFGAAPTDSGTMCVVDVGEGEKGRAGRSQSNIHELR